MAQANFTVKTNKLLLCLTIMIVLITLWLPLYIVLQQGLAEGFLAFWQAISDADALAALKLSLLAVAIAVPLNVIFGVAAAWAICKCHFPGKALLLTLIDLPFAISPVVVGLIYVILFGARSVLYPYLQQVNLYVIYAIPGIAMVTMFVSVPFVARELIPLMMLQGDEAEEAAIILGATGWQTFFYITLPNIKWALLQGTLLCSARALGEFGAVSIVSGQIRGYSNTLPLHIEMLYNEYHIVAAFSVAIIMLVLALTLQGIRYLIEHYHHRQTLTQQMALPWQKSKQQSMAFAVD